MEKLRWWSFVVLFGWLAQACSVAPAPDELVPGRMIRMMVAERVSAVVVTDQGNVDQWIKRNFIASDTPSDADGGSAAPITGDGYFLTADHVLAGYPSRNVFLIYGQGGRFTHAKARVVWRSESADLALLHIPVKTPFFYEWTKPDGWLPSGNGVIHGGISTGFDAGTGKLCTALGPESPFTGTRKFKIDLPLQPGDSGGPVVDAYGRLIGINSAVEFLVPMETALFIDSEGNRPNVRLLESLIRADRLKNHDASKFGEVRR